MRAYLNTQPRTPDRSFRYRIVGDGSPVVEPLAALFVYGHRYPNHQWRCSGHGTVACEQCQNVAPAGSHVHLSSFCPIEILPDVEVAAAPSVGVPVTALIDTKTLGRGSIASVAE